MNNLYPSYHAEMQMEIQPFNRITLPSPQEPSSVDKTISEFSLKKIHLEEGEELLVEPGAMLAMRNVSINTKIGSKSFLEGCKRYILGQELLFLNQFIGKKGGGWLSLEESMHEEMACIDLDGESDELRILQGSFIASTPNVWLKYPPLDFTQVGKNPKFQAPLMLEVKSDGPGRIYLGSNGSQIRTIDIKPEQGPVYIDNDRLIAISGKMECVYEKINNSHMQTVLSGNGLLLKFTGTGKVYTGCQIKRNNQRAVLVVANKLFQIALPYMIAGVILGLIISLKEPHLIKRNLFTVLYTNSPIENKCYLYHIGHSTRFQLEDWLRIANECELLCKKFWGFEKLVLGETNLEGRNLSCCCKSRFLGNQTIFHMPIKKLIEMSKDEAVCMDYEF